MLIPITRFVDVVIGNSVTVPASVIWPILLEPPASVNQRFPSGPAVIPVGNVLDVGTSNSVMGLDT